MSQALAREHFGLRESTALDLKASIACPPSGWVSLRGRAGALGGAERQGRACVVGSAFWGLSLQSRENPVLAIFYFLGILLRRNDTVWFSILSHPPPFVLFFQTG